MSKEIVRVLRILEYVGEREWVENTLNRSNVPLNGTSAHHTGVKNIIKSATIDQFPEVLHKVESDDLIKQNDELREKVKQLDEVLLKTKQKATERINELESEIVVLKNVNNSI